MDIMCVKFVFVERKIRDAQQKHDIWNNES